MRKAVTAIILAGLLYPAVPRLAHAAGPCPPSFEVVAVGDAFYDPAVDRNGNGVICMKVISTEGKTLKVLRHFRDDHE